MTAKNTKTILITGAGGFIGGRVLTLPLEGEIHAVLRTEPQSPSSVFWHQTDLLDRAEAVRLMETVQPTHLLHFAWDVRPGLYHRSLLNYQWVSATLHLLEQFQRVGGQRAVLVGTCFEYDLAVGFCTEDRTPLNTDTPYAACKSSLYHMVRSYAEQTGLSLGWGRIFFPFGPGEKPGRLVPSVIQSLLRGEPAATSHGNQLRDFLFVDDLAAAFVAFLASDVQGAVNLASGDPIRLKTVILTIAELIGREDLLRIGERQVGDEPPLILANTQRLNQEVGWQPHYTLREGLALTIAWWKQQMGII